MGKSAGHRKGAWFIESVQGGVAAWIGSTNLF